MSEIKGQILPESKFGTALTALAKNAKTIVEIGTWRGLGSTKCLANGMVNPEQRMWTIEADRKLHDEARANYSDERIKFLCGRGLELLTELPEHIDLLLLDGSDDETDAEFNALNERCDVICIDDSLERKNKHQRKLFLSSPDWVVLHDDTTERNGWMAAQRKVK